MTQEWFESADFEKTANNEKKDNPSDLVIPQEELKEKEELPVVEESLQANPEEQEADLEKVENGEHEEIVENTDKSEEPVETEEQEELATKTDQAEKPVKEANLWKVHLSQILSLQKLQSSKKNWLIFGSGYKVLLKGQQQALIQIKNIVIMPLCS